MHRVAESQDTDIFKASHVAQNTSLAFFTAHERNELKGHWGSKATRLTRDSFLPFGSCQLCLLPAREPVSCPSHGHLFCRECAVSNLLAQNKELKRLRKEAERRKLEEADEQDIEKAEAQARAVEEFERVQAGLSARCGGRAQETTVGGKDGKMEIEQGVEEGGQKGVKRKLEMDEDDRDDEVKKRIQHEKHAKSELPSFWVPGEIPDHQKSALKPIKQHPTCPAAAADAPHDFTLKTLVTVNFHQDSTGTPESPARSCPSCTKALSNSTKAIVAKPCGHVLCKPCGDKFLKPAERSAHVEEHDETVRCYVCQEDVTPGRKRRRRKDAETGEKETKVERGLVQLSCEGTGFASGGSNMVKKEGVAFQC